MKILFLISSLNAGGAERVVTLLANYLVEKHEVVVATLSNDEPFYDLGKSVEHQKLDLLRPSRNIFQKVVNSLYRLSRIISVIKRVDPDIVVSFMTHTNFLAILASKLTGRPVVVSERITFDFYGEHTNRIKRLIYPFCGALVVQTEKDAKNYSFVSNVKVVPNPLDPLEIEEFNKTKREKIVLAVGRLDEQKGFKGLITAFSKLDRKDWKLIIAGDGPEHQKLQNLIEALKLKNVELVGRKKNIFDLYAKASIFVLSSKKEGFPNVLLEAMACGCAVVSFDCPYGPSEIIENGVNGILVKNQDFEALGNALQRLMDDVELRRRIGDKALKVRDSYSIEKVAAQWMDIFEEIRSK
jgi:GalNAc-alpha-(1->4)-GalNAc-alpha-(1->3)-diNAcBac-PP-undecaprenol alpha-1,4-N-acetyl-D-galactosaminyltransferase